LLFHVRHSILLFREHELNSRPLLRTSLGAYGPVASLKGTQGSPRCPGLPTSSGLLREAPISLPPPADSANRPPPADSASHDRHI